MEAKGKTLLKVVGILMLIGGIFNVIGSVIGLLGGGLVALGASSDPTVSAGGAAIVTGLFIVYSIIMLVYGVVYIFTGITGIKHGANVEQAAKCQKWGIISLVLAVLSIVGSFLTDGFNVISLLALVLPILFIWGARKNMQSAA